MGDSLSEPAHQLLVRVAFLEGHLRGIEAMVRAGRSCLEVVQQVRAAEAGVRAARHLFVRRLIDRDLATPHGVLFVTGRSPHGGPARARKLSRR